MDQGKNKNLEKGYTVTEIVGISQKQRQPISLFSHIHSSKEKDYKSANTVTFTGLDEAINLLDEKGTFVFDRGYDMNELFKYMDKKKQHFIVRIKQNRKIFHKGKWYKSTALRDSRKGKIKTKIMFQNELKECYISHLNVQITASKKRVNLVLVYGLGDSAMMLVTNRAINKKSDVQSIVRDYMSRWRVEEYFRFKKQEYDFENYRVRSLKKMNNLNQVLTYALGMLGLIAEKKKDSALANMIIKNANALRKDIQFYGYQISKGIYNTLKNARTGIKRWQNIRAIDKHHQFEMDLDC